ncbi:MAG: type II secretion system F family protein [Nanoarchaeota archaeon]|nr:type II secretion system F family protein [Nanoarchaeota archaeon]
MGLIEFLISNQKFLKKRLRIAQIKEDPKDYVKKALKNALTMGFGVGAGAFFLLAQKEVNLVIPLVAAIFVTLYMYNISMKKIDVAITKRARAIDAKVLFAGRFLLVKLNSGKPLITAIEEAAREDNAASDYLKEILREVNLGTPIEQALEKSTEYCPSEYLKKILFQISNALRIGVDVTNFLQAILDEISDEQLNQILRYGKKLSSLSMFYMLAAVIVPSLGMTLFVVVASLISLDLNMTAFGIIIGLLLVVQFIFITLFKSSRPIMDV